MGNAFASSFRGPNGAAPFLKWAGGKQWLVRHVAHLVPTEARYFEPFLGAGSVFFATQPPMDIPRLFNITDSAHRIHNPFTPDKFATLGAALRLEPEDRVVSATTSTPI